MFRLTLFLLIRKKLVDSQSAKHQFRDQNKPLRHCSESQTIRLLVMKGIAVKKIITNIITVLMPKAFRGIQWRNGKNLSGMQRVYCNYQYVFSCLAILKQTYDSLQQELVQRLNNLFEYFFLNSIYISINFFTISSM